jgi:hypothetical protein
MGKHLKTVSIVLVTLLVCGGGAAGAASLMSGKRIKKSSIPLNRLTKKTQKLIKKKSTVGSQSVTPGPKGATGATGATGAKGAQGNPGASGTATYAGPHWSLIDRNTIGSPVGALRSGPNEGTGPGSAPPMGVGSLGFTVGNPNEKVAFGNEVDFAGDAVADLDAVGFSVFWTGEDKAKFADNLPNITFEVDRNGGSLDLGDYSSLVFNPDATPSPDPALPTNRFVPIDATSDTAGTWYFTNNSAGTGCIQATPCTFSALKTAVNGTADAETILTLAVAKGRDYEWQGAIDALRYNGNIYNFEPFGVITTAAP